jgi:hypothetical protein
MEWSVGVSRKTFVRYMMFGGIFRGRSFQVTYRRDGDWKNPAKTWSAHVEWTPVGSTMPLLQSMPHLGRAPCMTDALKLMLVVSKPKPKGAPKPRKATRPVKGHTLKIFKAG